MTVSFAEKNDIKSWMGLLDLVKDNFPGLDKEDYEKRLAEIIIEKQALVFKDNYTVRGALAFSSENKEIEFLAVHPQYRRKGIAKALFGFMLAQLPKGCDISVITYREGDIKGKAARMLYQSMGFRPGRLLTVYDYPCQEFIYTNG